ncbi:hypothetical protein [Ensifer sp. SL37]|uniref:hypothetical protein n=1 Tax=Ensifer sp. SL37 TaxID=2995137 RepID=UPI002272914C|nr:hypothetical protein [Ensifer sp. SL37]MCY1741447.1 hypothetical protein [Ensifer sp. SL37]
MIERTHHHGQDNYSCFAVNVLHRARAEGALEGWTCTPDDYRAQRVQLQFKDTRQAVLFKITYGGE